MGWREILENKSSKEIGEQGKQVIFPKAQVPQFPLFPALGQQSLSITANLAELEVIIGKEEFTLLSLNPAKKELFLHAITTIKQRLAGEIPPHYTATTHCQQCGEVAVPPALANGGYVLACPYCMTSPSLKNILLNKVNKGEKNNET